MCVYLSMAILLQSTIVNLHVIVQSSLRKISTLTTEIMQLNFFFFAQDVRQHK